MIDTSLVIVLGGGGIGSAIAHYLYSANIPTAIVLGNNTVILQRKISFYSAGKIGIKQIQDIKAELISPEELSALSNKIKSLDAIWIEAIHYRIKNKVLPVWTKHEFPKFIEMLMPKILIKTEPNEFSDIGIEAAPLVLGLYPHHKPGNDCHLSVESQLNYWLGTVYYSAPMGRKKVDLNFFKNPFEEIRSPISGVFVELYKGHSDFAYENFSFYHRAIAGAFLKEITHFLYSN
jgi:hypothetical protein